MGGRRAVRASAGMPLARKPNSMFSVTVFHGKSELLEHHGAVRARPRHVAPADLTAPAVGNSSPAAMRRQVVLPQPDGPTMVTNSRSRTPKLTASSVRKSLPSRRNTFVTPSNAMSLIAGEQDLRRGRGAVVEIAEARARLRERALFDPREVAERASRSARTVARRSAVV